jgi:alkylation response protein AidB-like acyl-CoA dehydrogenase
MPSTERPSTERSEMQSALREFLSPDRGPAIGAVGTMPEDPHRWWKALAEFGVFALPVPAESDGLGLGLEESALAFEELGHAVAWGPLVWSQLAALALPELAAGHLIVAGVDLTAQQEGDPVLVEHLAVADRMLALGDGGVLLYDKNDIEYTDLDRPLDPHTPVARLNRRGQGDLVADAATADRLRRVGTLLSAAFLLGISDTAVRSATEYAGQRQQFGRPIGSFQAIKHLLADCYVRTGLARAALYAAAEFEAATFEGAEPAASTADLAAAKLLCGRAADANARTAVQVFGGMGFTWETIPHVLLKRAWVLDSAFGTAAEHALAVGDELARTLEPVA